MPLTIVETSLRGSLALAYTEPLSSDGGHIHSLDFFHVHTDLSLKSRAHVIHIAAKYAVVATTDREGESAILYACNIYIYRSIYIGFYI